MAETPQNTLQLSPGAVSGIHHDYIRGQQAHAADSEYVRPVGDPFAAEIPDGGVVVTNGDTVMLPVRDVDRLPINQNIDPAGVTAARIKREAGRYRSESARADSLYAESMSSWDDNRLLLDAELSGKVVRLYADEGGNFYQQNIDGGRAVFFSPPVQKKDGSVKWTPVYDSKYGGWSQEGDQKARLQKAVIPKWENLMPTTTMTRQEIEAEMQAKAGDSGALAVLGEHLMSVQSWEDRLTLYEMQGMIDLSITLRSLQNLGPDVRALRLLGEKGGALHEAMRREDRILQSAREFMSARKMKDVVGNDLAVRERARVKRVRRSRDPYSPLGETDGEKASRLGREKVREAYMDRPGRRMDKQDMIDPVFRHYKRMLMGDRADQMSRGYVETSDSLGTIRTIDRLMDANKVPYLAGAAGVAKTNLAIEIARRRSGKEPIVMDMEPDTSGDQLKGVMSLENGNTDMKLVGVLLAMKEGRIAVLNEINVLLDKTTLYGLLTMKPGQLYDDGTNRFIVADGFGVIGTLNTGYDSELANGFGHVSAEMEEPFRQRGEIVPIYPPDYTRVPDYFDSAEPLVKPDGTTDILPDGWIELMSSVVTDRAGRFYPEDAPELAGLTESEFVRFMCLVHTAGFLERNNANDVLGIRPELFAKATGNVAPQGTGKLPLLRKTGMSPRTVSYLLNYLQGVDSAIDDKSPVYQMVLANPIYEGESRYGVDDMLRQFIGSLLEKGDREVMTNLAKSFGFLGEPPTRGDYKMPELFTAERKEVELAFENWKTRREDKDNETLQGAKPWPDNLYKLERYEEGAKDYIATAVSKWNALAAQPGAAIGNVPANYEGLLAAAGNKTEAVVRRLKALMQTQDTIRKNNLEGVDGNPLQTEIVLVPAAEMKANIGNLGDWLKRTAAAGGMSLSFEPAVESVFSDPTRQTYLDPSGVPITFEQHLDALIDAYGPWVPMLSAPINTPVTASITDSAEKYGTPPRISGIPVGGGILEGISAWFVAQKSPTQQNLRLLGSEIQRSGARVAPIAKAQGNNLIVTAVAFQNGTGSAGPPLFMA